MELTDLGCRMLNLNLNLNLSFQSIKTGFRPESFFSQKDLSEILKCMNLKIKK